MLEQYDGSKEWPRGGGWPTNEFLEKMGFEVREIKDNPLSNLVKKYIKHISSGGLNNEIYKWRLLKQFQERPDTNITNIIE